MHINYFNADERADKSYLIRLWGKTKMIGLFALLLIITSIIVAVMTNQYGTKAIDNKGINGNILFRIEKFKFSIFVKFLNLYRYFLFQINE